VIQNVIGTPSQALQINEFRTTGQRNEKQSLLLQQRRVELSHLWPQVGTAIGLEASFRTQFSFHAAKFVVS
jgi:hypothetical protein